MRRVKVRTDYSGIGESDLAILAGKIAVFMDGNPHFSTDIVPLATDLAVAAEDYRLKHEVAVNGGSSLEKELKKAAKTKLLNMLSHLANVVNYEARGNMLALSSTGLHFHKSPAAEQIPGTTGRIILRDGRLSGQLRVDFEKIPYAYEYELQIGEMEVDSDRILWGESYMTSSSINTTIAPLIPGRQYYIRVRGRNKTGTGDWSDSVTRMVR